MKWFISGFMPQNPFLDIIEKNHNIIDILNTFYIFGKKNLHTTLIWFPMM